LNLPDANGGVYGYIEVLSSGIAKLVLAQEILKR
jgi:hypothetical protein